MSTQEGSGDMVEEWMKNAGRWQVFDTYVTTSRGEKKYLCRCDCGTERYVLERSLRYGGSQSCGCLRRQRVREANTHQLEGKAFGDLRVLRRAGTKYDGVRWLCVCSCGKEIEVAGTLLVTGKKTHCGCKAQYHFADITGERFSELTALYVQSREKGRVIWHCRCSCGNEVDISYNELVYSHRKSCGCRKEAHEKQLHTTLTHVSGTSIDAVRSKKTPADNTSGTKGVYFIRGKYVAKIVFQKKVYYLGSYAVIEEAIAARRKAEEALFDGTVVHYEHWKARADADPHWAAENPFSVCVGRNASGELEPTFLPTALWKGQK